MQILMNHKIAAHALVAKHVGTTIREMGYSWVGIVGGDHIIKTGGTLYAVDLVIQKVKELPRPTNCPSRIELDTPRRPVNGLNIECGTPAARCFCKPPVNCKGIEANAFKWLGSGGSPLAFGVCDVNDCPRRQ